MFVPRFKREDEKDIRVYSATLAMRLPRAAGRGSEIVFVEKLVEPGCVAVGKGF